MIDLHVHSTFSDGSDTPAQLVAAGARLGLHALALTDHDTVAGAAEFLDACRRHGMIGFTGVEISAEVPAGTMHILGYGVDPLHAELLRNLGQVLDGRAWRNEQILSRLNGLGMKLAWDDVASLAGEDVVGRPHFARAMQAHGYVSGMQDAFDRYLAKGGPAYVDRFRLEPEAGIRLLRAAGGLPVLAHAFTWEPDVAALETKLLSLKGIGLGGLEVYYPELGFERTIAYLRLARRLGLVATGGTDYHGLAKPNVRLGTADGGFAVPDALVPPLAEAIAGRNDANACFMPTHTHLERQPSCT